MSRLVRQTIPSPLPWTSQPQVATEIDWANPITKGMKLCLVPRISLIDLASPSVKWIASAGSNPTNVISKHGLGLHVVRDIYCAPPFRVDTKEQTQLVLMDWEGSDEPFSGIFGTGNSIGEYSFGVSRDEGQLSIVGQQGFNTRIFKDTSSLKEGAFLIKGSTVGFSVYDKGKLLQSGTTITPLWGMTATPIAVISSDMYRDGTYVSYTSNYLYVFWERELSNSEAISATTNPWQIFRPLKRNLPAFDIVRGALEARQSYMMGTTPPTVSANMPAAVGLKNVWASQPQVPVEIDWSNPITRGLTAVYIPSAKADAKGAGAFTTVTRSLNGIATATDSGNSIPTGVNAKVSYFVVASLNAVTADAVAIGRVRYNGSTNYGACLRFNGANIEANKADGTAVWSYASVTGAVSVGRNSYGAAIQSGAASEVYKNGKKLTINDFYSENTYIERNETGIDIGKATSTGQTAITAAIGGVIEVGFVFNRVLSDSEFALLHANPWQIFRPLTKQVLVPA